MTTKPIPALPPPGTTGATTGASTGNTAQPNAALPDPGDPEQKAPKLTYWARKNNIDGDNEATIKNFLVDAIANCASCPDNIQGITVGEAQEGYAMRLDQDNGRISSCCNQYGVQYNSLTTDSRLRLREDGELETYNVKQPFEQSLQPARISANRPNDADYPANAELKKLITSDIWRKLTQSEREAAVAQINEELANRRNDMEILARLECSALPGNSSAKSCFCQKPGCTHERILPESLPSPDAPATDTILVRPPEDYDTPQTPNQVIQKRNSFKQPAPIKPTVARNSTKTVSSPWFGPRP